MQSKEASEVKRQLVWAEVAQAEQETIKQCVLKTPRASR